MGIFDFIKRKRKENFDLDEFTVVTNGTEELNNSETELNTSSIEFNNNETELDAPSKELFTASETELKTNKKMENHNTNLIQKIINEINLFCIRDLESKGFKDCMENSDMLNKEMNRKLIFADFKILIETSVSELDNRIFEFKQKINTYDSAGMTESSTKFKTYVEEYDRYKNEISEFIKDESKQKEKIEFTLLSYEIGFNNGLKNNDNELI
jgi:hypothetical protein